MLRMILESIVGPMSDNDFRDTMELATDDIRINRVGFNQQTSLPIVVDISVSCYSLVQRIKKSSLLKRAAKENYSPVVYHKFKSFC